MSCRCAGGSIPLKRCRVCEKCGSELSTVEELLVHNERCSVKISEISIRLVVGIKVEKVPMGYRATVDELPGVESEGAELSGVILGIREKIQQRLDSLLVDERSQQDTKHL